MEFSDSSAKHQPAEGAIARRTSRSAEPVATKHIPQGRPVENPRWGERVPSGGPFWRQGRARGSCCERARYQRSNAAQRTRAQPPGSENWARRALALRVFANSGSSIADVRFARADVDRIKACLQKTGSGSELGRVKRGGPRCRSGHGAGAPVGLRNEHLSAWVMALARWRAIVALALLVNQFSDLRKGEHIAGHDLRLQRGRGNHPQHEALAWLKTCARHDSCHTVGAIIDQT